MSKRSTWPVLSAAMRQAVGLPTSSERLAKGSRTSSVLSLPLWCCEAVGGDATAAIKLTSSWYLFYCSANVFDKVQDRDPPEPWWESKGDAFALNTAVGLLLTASELLFVGLQELTPQKREWIASSFYRCLFDATGGQQYDLSQELIDLESWKKVSNAKSGAVFSLACQIGAIIASENILLIDSLGSFGSKLGKIVQIVNDIEAIVGTRSLEHSIVPKAIFRSLPVLYSLEILPEDQKHSLIQVVQSLESSRENYKRLREILNQAGAFVFLEAEIQRHKLDAEALLLNLVEPSDARHQLLNFLTMISQGDS